MNVIVASHNPAKLSAAEQAFRRVFPGTEITVIPLGVPSGIKDQPDSDDETRHGALNRVRGAHEAHPQADFWVGMEGGLERIDGHWLASAWMAVRDPQGKEGLARTPTLPLPPPICELLDGGLELGDANDRVFATHNSKQKGGAFGLLTDGRQTRGGVYAQTIELALIPLIHELWP